MLLSEVRANFKRSLSLSKVTPHRSSCYTSHVNLYKVGYNGKYKSVRDREYQSNYHLRSNIHLIVIHRKNNDDFGFSYEEFMFHRIKHVSSERVFYVTSVKPNGNAYNSGLRCGDIILSTNGISTAKYDEDVFRNTLSSNYTLRLLVSKDKHIRRAIISNKRRHLQLRCYVGSKHWERNWKHSSSS
ncbi:hypothetical protein GJ496_001226 [Pomphorhynchus laevis]|nr:hypothetical protein GJ496_001226 [Pomphorhynchus laevis]